MNWVCWSRAHRFGDLEQHGWTPVGGLNIYNIIQKFNLSNFCKVIFINCCHFRDLYNQYDIFKKKIFHGTVTFNGQDGGVGVYVVSYLSTGVLARSGGCSSLIPHRRPRPRWRSHSSSARGNSAGPGRRTGRCPSTGSPVGEVPVVSWSRWGWIDKSSC